MVDYLLEHVNEVIVLAMDVAHDDDWFLHPSDVRLALYNTQQCINKKNTH